MKLRQMRPARAGGSRGLILALPGIHGTDTDVLPLTRNSLAAYDLWSAHVELNGARVDDSQVWLDFARRVADAVLASAIPRPAALVGFSIGGYLGWLIDRVLVGAGFDPTPVIILDGGALHLHRKSWAQAVPPLLPTAPDLPAPKILLAHSASPGRLRLPQSSYADWQRLGVAVEALPYRTVEHPDFKRPRAIAAAASAFESFVGTGSLAAADRQRQIDIDTPGNSIFRALVAPEPPSVAALEPLAATPLSANPNVLASLLFLSAATGHVPFALEICQRARKVSPRFWPATYAAIAVLREAGRDAESADLAAAWHRDDPGKRRPTARPPGAERPSRPWGSLEGVVIGSDASLDFAAAFCRPGSRRA